MSGLLGPIPAPPAFSDTRWTVSSRAHEFDSVDASSDCQHFSDLEARYVSPAVEPDEELLAPSDLLSSFAEAAAPPLVSPSPSRAAMTPPAPRASLTVVRRTAFVVEPKPVVLPLSDHERALSMPIPKPAKATPHLTFPVPSAPPADSLRSPSSGDSSADDLSPGSSAARRQRRVSRLTKSPEGPKFAAGSYKNAPAPAALPPPPAMFCASPPLLVPAQSSVLAPIACGPLVAAALPFDPAIIAAALPAAPAKLPSPSADREEMRLQLCQLLKIKA